MISCFQLNLVSNVFQTCLKGFKLNVEPKMAQPVEPDEEPVNLPTQPVEGCKKTFSLSKRLFNRSRCEQ